jgi:DNA topoisomerase-1
MILIIVESPAKCKKIESYLGSAYKCLASYGHIREFSDGLKSIDKNYKASYKISQNKQKYVKILRSAIKSATDVILATDDDREGEAIAWHICQVFNLPVKTTKRIIFHEVTKTALLKAVLNPTIIDMDKVQAQQARQILDLIVGFTTSPILWKYISRKTEKGLSAGRCQTPALRLVYENEKVCSEAKGENVYETVGKFMNIDYKLNKFFKNKSDMKSFLEKTKTHQHILSVTDKKRMKKSPPKPFTTSTLQQKASNSYNFSPKNTMKLAQTLYENGYITYMRTDNAKYSKDFVDDTGDYIKRHWDYTYIGDNDITNAKDAGANAGANAKANAGAAKANAGAAKANAGAAKANAGAAKANAGAAKAKDADKLAQEAHEAIRPTNIYTETIHNNPKIGKYELKLYELIWKNSLQSCMSSSMYDVLYSNVTSPEIYIYKNTIEKNTFLGWEITDGIKPINEYKKLLKYLSKSEEINYTNIKSTMTIKHLKSHYTEARLVQLLEKNGIGRPSTFSSLVSKLLERNYVVKTNIKGKKLSCLNFSLTCAGCGEIKETEKVSVFGEEKNKLKIEPIGIIVMDFLNKYFDNMFNYDYTKQMEGHLDDICSGKMSIKKICGNCKDELDNSISCITNNKMDGKNDGKNDGKKGIKIDSNHRLIIGKYGPVILCNIDDKVTFKKVKKDIDMDKLKRGEYSLADILYESFSKSLGKINDDEIIVKSGKFGMYCSYNGKNISLKYTNKTLETITLEDVKKLVSTEKKATSLKKLNDDASIRQGKWGPYVYYKTDKMKKPRFIPIKKIAWKEIDMDWVYDNL